MKKIVSILILTFMILGLLAGCVPTPNTNGGVDQNTENGGNETESDGSTENDADSEPGVPEDDNPPEGDNPNANPDNPESSTEVGSEIGDLFDDVTLKTLEGGSVSTADYRGKIIILNIWATWCGFCTVELPDFSSVASEYADDVVVIAAHAPSGSANAPAYVEANFKDSKIIFAYDTYNEAFIASGGTRYVPRTVVIDRDGVILHGQDGVMTYEHLLSIIESAKQ